ncbi:hypothetical protein [Geodermatophilus marinus]|uniref:hypothetical protein n=1 Tax=Geodermatophilus sp. LHW52908 TaxID=2303986 RepID=UPI000E3B8447|nr:hypothetical protein [Geodermatophilus sp. LHW52908]RFU21205.1 hypothetical protein D0Z06_12540 [Geodermatophilus sp. LHW52908]
METTRWLAPLFGVAGLLALAVGIVWAELDNTAVNAGLVGLGALGLLLGLAVVAVHEGVARRR